MRGGARVVRTLGIVAPAQPHGERHHRGRLERHEEPMQPTQWAKQHACNLIQQLAESGGENTAFTRIGIAPQRA